MAQAVAKAHQMLAAKSICTEDVTVEFLEQQLYTQVLCHMDLCILSCLQCTDNDSFCLTVKHLPGMMTHQTCACKPLLQAAALKCAGWVHVQPNVIWACGTRQALHV